MATKKLNDYKLNVGRLMKTAQEESQPGDVSPALKRRMRDDDIVEMFQEAGRSLYKEVVESLKGVLREQFERSIPDLDQLLKEEGGRRWQKDAAQFYRPWINDMVETIVTQGMNEAAGALEDVASDYAAEKSAPDEDEGEDEPGDELIEVPLEEVEEVDLEEDEEEPEPAEEEEELDEDLGELEELLAADTLPRTIRRPRPRRREVKGEPYYPLVILVNKETGETLEQISGSDRNVEEVYNELENLASEKYLRDYLNGDLALEDLGNQVYVDLLGPHGGGHREGRVQAEKPSWLK